MRIGIIGGGVTGLVAGYDLSRAGHQVEVFERSSVLGGQAAVFDLDGTLLERFYHHIFVSDRHVVQLMEELGLADRLKWIDSSVGLFHSGRVWPWVTPQDLLRFNAISLWDRLRLGLVTLYLQRKGDGMQYENVTASQWLSRRVGRRAYEAVWGPLLRGKFGDYADDVSMTWLWGKIRLRVGSRGRGMQKERLGYPAGSFQVLLDGLASRIAAGGGQVHTSAPVLRVEESGGKVSGLRVALPGGAEESRPYDAVLATIPSFDFERIVPELTGDYVDKLHGVTYLSALVLVLTLDRSFMPVYWLSIADRSLPFVGVIEHTNFLPPETYGGRHVLYVSNYLKSDNPLYSMSADQLLAEYVQHLKRINPSFEMAWVREKYLFRENGAQPVITRGYSQRIPDHRTPIGGLYLANTTQIYPEDRGVNYSVRLGRQAAELVQRSAA